MPLFWPTEQPAVVRHTRKMFIIKDGWLKRKQSRDNGHERFRATKHCSPSKEISGH